LEGVVVDEGLLHRMQWAVRLGEALDRRDVAAFGRGGEREAREHTPAVDKHGARAALAVVAPFFGSGQTEVFAQSVKERRADVEGNETLTAVDPQRKSDRRADIPRVLRQHGLCRSGARYGRQSRG
jgi:hypothetical protein